MTVVISKADRAAKLALIANLRADEIDGYEIAAQARGYFDGELAALMARFRVVGKSGVVVK